MECRGSGQTHAVGGVSGASTTRCDGRDKACHGWVPEVSIVTNGMLTAWKGTLPRDWFTFNCYENILQVANMIDDYDVFPLVAKYGTIIWMLSNECEISKNTLITSVRDICKTAQDVRPGTVVFFVTHVPLIGDSKFEVTNYNNNLMFVVRKLKRENEEHVRTIALHHWCLKQNKRWEDVTSITESERGMLVFLVMNEVLDVLGLAARLRTYVSKEMFNRETIA